MNKEDAYWSGNHWARLGHDGAVLGLMASQTGLGGYATYIALTNRWTIGEAIKWFSLRIVPVNWLILIVEGLYLVWNYFKDSELQQFLEQCCWGNARRWDDSPEQASAELQTLIDLLFKPRLQATGLLTSRHSGGSDHSIVIGSKTDSLQLYLPGADPSRTQLHLRLAAINAAGTPTDYTRQWLATVQSQWLPIHQGMGLRLSGKLPAQPEGGHWQLQVIYHSPLAMLTGTLNPRQLMVGGNQGMRYIIRGTSITEHGSSDGPLVSDRLPAVEVERKFLTPRGSAMNAQAGDIERGFLRQQEHLAPLPIPTGQTPQDLMNIIWRKNPVYLDIGSFAMGGGFMTLHLGTLLFVSIGIWFASKGQIWVTLAFVAFFSALMGTLWYLFIKQWRKPLTPPLRFNRQRREVCVTEPNGNYWFVPWERVHAVSPSALSLNTGGTSKQGALILWLPLEGQEHEAYSENKPGWVMMLNTGGGMGSMAQWECIRSFMEIGPEAVPDTTREDAYEKVQRGGYLGAWIEAFKQLFRELKQGRFGAACMTFLGLTIFGLPWIAVLMIRKLANIPDLTAPEAVEWSKPLPLEQWAKRSPALEQAIAEREAELAHASSVT